MSVNLTPEQKTRIEIDNPPVGAIHELPLRMGISDRR